MEGVKELVRMAVIRVYKRQRLERVWRKGSPPALLVGKRIGTTTVEGSMQVPQETAERPYDPAIPLLGTYPDKIMFQKDTCTPRFTAALLTLAKTWKQPKCPLTDERI